MSEFKLMHKNPEGAQYKYSNTGNMKINQWGNWSIGLQVSRLKEAIVAAEREGKSFVNLSAFEDKPPVNEVSKHSEDKGNGFVKQPDFKVEDLDDEIIPF